MQMQRLLWMLKAERLGHSVGHIIADVLVFSHVLAGVVIEPD